MYFLFLCLSFLGMLYHPCLGCICEEGDQDSWDYGKEKEHKVAGVVHKGNDGEKTSVEQVPRLNLVIYVMIIWCGVLLWNVTSTTPGGFTNIL